MVKYEGVGKMPEALGMVGIIIGGVCIGIALILMLINLVMGKDFKSIIEPSNYHKLSFINLWLAILFRYLHNNGDYENACTYIIAITQMLFIFGMCTIWCLKPGEQNVCKEMLITYLSFRETAGLARDWFEVWSKMFSEAAVVLKILTFIAFLYKIEEDMSDPNKSALLCSYIAMLWGSDYESHPGYGSLSDYGIYLACSILLLLLFHWKSKKCPFLRMDWIIYFAAFGVCAPTFSAYSLHDRRGIPYEASDTHIV